MEGAKTKQAKPCRSTSCATASKKIGNAVTRNHVRRRIREAYRMLEPQIKDGYDIVIVARHASETMLFTALTDEMKSLMTALGVIKEEKGDA